MAKYSSGRVRKFGPSGITSDRYDFLGLEQAEPDLGDPKIGVGSTINNPYPSSPLPAETYVLVSVPEDSGGKTGSRYWVELNDIKGFQGTQGLQGIKGQDGIAIDGADGIQGRQGTQGLSNQGVQGLQGLSVQSTQGLSVQGAQGLSGSAAAWTRKTSNYCSTNVE